LRFRNVIKSPLLLSRYSIFNMHGCLRIYEVVCLICNELQVTKFGWTLANLARTCTALQDPALDALWYELDDLSPLIMCMPLDAWEEDNDGNVILVRKN
jgi:hypothetical protein